METETIKRTKTKVVPRLRFKEFQGDWFPSKLKNGMELISGQHLSPEEYDTSSSLGFPYFTGPSDFTDNPINVRKWTDVSRKFATKGDVLITVKGSGVGTMTVLKLDKVAMGRQLMGLSSTKFDSEFVYQYLLKKQNLFVALASGNMIPGLSRQDILTLKIFTPSSTEQQKIASVLSTVDKKIQQLTHKKELLKTYKKGVMQKLFSQEIRFNDENGNKFPEWEKKYLSDITTTTTGSSNRVDSSLVGKYTFFDRSEDIRTSDKYLFDAEAVIVPGEGQNFIPKHFEGKFDLHQRTYAIMDFKKCLGKFIYFYISFHTKHLLSQAVGSTVKSLRLPMFKKMKISLPAIQEQQKISGFLSAIDYKIEAVSQEIKKTQTFKKGLLQQMFV